MYSLFPTLALCAVVAAFEAAPVLVASHKLVTGLRDEIERPYTKTQDPINVTNMIKKLVTECSSDVYMLLNMPGLEHTDLIQDRATNWPNLVKYLHMSSSVVGMPWMEGTLDLPFLETYITRTCSAEAITVTLESDDEVQQYLDTRARVIRVEFNPLPTSRGERDHALRQNDDLLRRILRKSPLPHYTIILTLTTKSGVHPHPDFIFEEMPERFELFHDIVNDPRRDEESERNNYLYKDVEPVWNDNDPNKAYLLRKKQDEVHLFDFEHWQNNERLLTTVALMVATVFVMKTWSIVKWSKGKVTEKSRGELGGLKND